jgi:multiple sugar transport system substrate-binding protein
MRLAEGGIIGREMMRTEASATVRRGDEQRMDGERRTALEDALRSLRAGRMTRRTFLGRALALGLTAGAAVGLMEACGRRHVTFLVWESEHDETGVYASLVEHFNTTNHANIHVTYRNGPPDANELHSDQQTMLKASSGSTDILSMDITWPAEYAARGWLRPVDEHWPVVARTQFLRAAQQAAELNGQLWAAPYRLDVGAIYYRTDLLEQPPVTWEALAARAVQLTQVRKAAAGYVWAGAASEGLVCLFNEMLASYGGAVFAPDDPYTVTLNTPAAAAALANMMGWLSSGASPAAVTTYADDGSRQSWAHGGAAFMRNWLSAYPLPGDGNWDRVRAKIGLAPIPANTPGAMGQPCLGGWQIGINAFARLPDAAWEFISYLLTPSRLMDAARYSGLQVALTTAYEDPSLLARQPALARMKPLLAGAQPRPISPIYSAVTAALQARLHQALVGKLSPAEALAALQTHLQALSTRARPLPADVPTVTATHS